MGAATQKATRRPKSLGRGEEQQRLPNDYGKTRKRRARRGKGWPPTPRAVALSVIRYYEALAPRYDAKYSNPSMAYMRSVEWSILLASLPPPPSLLLDLGCGTGRFTAALARHGHRVIGLDLAPTMLHLAERRARRHPSTTQHIHPLCASAERLPLRPEILDGVLALFGVLNHVSSLTRTLRGLSRSLRPGALLLSTLANRLSLPNLISRTRRIGLRTLLSRPPSWIRLYTREAHCRIWTRLYSWHEARLALKAAGFITQRAGGLLFALPPCYHHKAPHRQCSPPPHPRPSSKTHDDWWWRIRASLEERLRWLPLTNRFAAYLVVLARRA